MRLLAEIDGVATPLDECEWVLWAPCGCVPGVLVADEAPTEDAAWREFYPTKRERDRKQRQGYRMELVTHARWRDEISDLMRAGRPHQVGDLVAQSPPRRHRCLIR